MRRLLTDFRRGDLSGRYRYPLRLEKVPQIPQIYTDLLWEVLVTQISQMTQIFFHRMTRNLFGGFPDEAINHGFSRRRPIRSVQIPTEVGICPTDFTDIHRFLFIGLHGIYSEVFLRRRLLTDFRRGDLSGRCRYPLRLEYVPQISQIYTDFYSSDDTEFIRRFPAETINHGFSRRRPIRSVQIPTESGQRDSTEIPLKICVYL